ncbi:MAG: hypothetical protein C0507_08765 [Cyanobacteria bacterium PR.3.49]|nr:hypothetical protein [Cyanobacteria bacterium PR.3.49]
MTNTKKRLFVGTFLDAQSASAVANFKSLNPDLSQKWQLKARFVPLPKLHLTWLFLGDVEQDLLENVKTDLEETIRVWKESENGSAFEISYDSLVVWSSLKSPRVLVLESTGACPPATSLNQAINIGLGNYLDKSDKMERFDRFRPHLTICRFSPDSRMKTKTRRNLDDVQTAENLFPLPHRIDTVSLIESDLKSGPNGYSSILDISLHL